MVPELEVAWWMSSECGRSPQPWRSPRHTNTKSNMDQSATVILHCVKIVNHRIEFTLSYHV